MSLRTGLVQGGWKSECFDIMIFDLHLKYDRKAGELHEEQLDISYSHLAVRLMSAAVSVRLN